MDIKISDDTLKKTTKCNKDFACLSSKTCDVCKVTHSLGPEVKFIDCKEQRVCPYCLPFGDGFMCTCPVRLELHNKHEI